MNENIRNKPKMAYSRDLLKMASVALWIEIAVILDWR